MLNRKYKRFYRISRTARFSHPSLFSLYYKKRKIYLQILNFSKAYLICGMYFCLKSFETGSLEMIWMLENITKDTKNTAKFILQWSSWNVKWMIVWMDPICIYTLPHIYLFVPSVFAAEWWFASEMGMRINYAPFGMAWERNKQILSHIYPSVTGNKYVLW